MSDKEFVHLHVHSDFSMQDGVSKITSILNKVKASGMKAMALTDHGYLSGVIEFYKAAKERGIKPLIGVETYVAKNSIDLKNPENKETNHLILIAKNLTGYKNLVKLMSIAATTGFYHQARIDKEILKAHSNGLIASTACLQGAVNVNLYDSKDGSRQVNLPKAEQELEELISIFGKDNVFVEVMYHGLDSQKQVCANAMKLAKKMDMKIIATNDAHYVDSNQRDLRDIMMADRCSTTVNDPERKLKDAEGEYYIKTPAEMHTLWGKYPEVIQNTLAIAEMVEEFNPGINEGNKLPKFCSSNEESLDTFKKMIIEGFKEKYPGKSKNSEEWNRVQYEVSVIEKLGFRDYFLILADIVKYCVQNNISVGPGRGSAAGSIIAYCMDITTVEPISNGLIFERFLSPDRADLPDIDIDVCKNNRNKIIQYISNKYGEDKVCQIGTFNRLKGRGILRTVGRALDMPFDEVDELSKSMPKDAGEYSISLNQVMDPKEECDPNLKSTFFRYYERSKKNKQYIDSCLRLENVLKSSGVHAAGVVIGPETLSNIVPLKLSNSDGIATQLDMNNVQELGLLKLDLLGLDTLSFISDCLTSINKDNPEGPLKDKKGINTYRDLEKEFPNNDDELVYKSTFSLGATIGVFQCEGFGLRSLLARMRASQFSDIAAAIALYRPGPLDSGITESFIQRRMKKEEETIWHNDLNKEFDETHGLAIYQEQIMAASRVLCGFSMIEANKLRKVIGKKKKEDIEAFREKFVSAAVKTNKIDKEKSEIVYDAIEKYGRYAFNKSHSVSYAKICYYTAWLKTYYPAYALASLLNKFCGIEVEKGTTSVIDKKIDDDKISEYLLEAMSMGIRILPPDIAESNFYFKVVKTDKGTAIRYGIGAIKSVSMKAVKLLEWRDSKGQFKNMGHFLFAGIQCGMNKRSLSEIVDAGCTNFGIPKSQAMELLHGFKRPCRCTKAKDASPEKTKNCKICQSTGLTRSEKSILEDIRDIAKEHSEVNEQMINELGELFKPYLGKSSKDIEYIDSINLYISKKEVSVK